MIWFSWGKNKGLICTSELMPLLLRSEIYQIECQLASLSDSVIKNMVKSCSTGSCFQMDDTEDKNPSSSAPEAAPKEDTALAPKEDQEAPAAAPEAAASEPTAAAAASEATPETPAAAADTPAEAPKEAAQEESKSEETPMEQEETPAAANGKYGWSHLVNESLL